MISNVHENSERRDDRSPDKCRERRWRLIKMKRRVVIGHQEMKQSETQSLAEASGCASEEKRLRKAEVGGCPAESAVTDRLTNNADVGPVFGTMSVSGRSRQMEDAFCVQTELCRPDLNLGRPVHFFAVFDGHGGAHVAELCRAKMHMFVEEELMRAKVGEESGGGGRGCDEEGQWRKAMKRSFERMDEEAVSACASGSGAQECGCNPLELAVAGSTAVVAVLTDLRILVANCGDSRAVLCRAGSCFPLTVDHKPDRPDELERIEAAGGRVISFHGARVEGVLAMSRAIGDRYLKPLVIPEPEITFMDREPEDECLILASDGLWDVVPGDLACRVVHECLKERSHSGSPQAGAGDSRPCQIALAAALLTRLALGRRSSDNITVIVVDLKKGV